MRIRAGYRQYYNIRLYYTTSYLELIGINTPKKVSLNLKNLQGCPSKQNDHPKLLQDQMIKKINPLKMTSLHRAPLRYTIKTAVFCSMGTFIWKLLILTSDTAITKQSPRDFNQGFELRILNSRGIYKNRQK